MEEIFKIPVWCAILLTLIGGIITAAAEDNFPPARKFDLTNNKNIQNKKDEVIKYVWEVTDEEYLLNPQTKKETEHKVIQTSQHAKRDQPELENDGLHSSPIGNSKPIGNSSSTSKPNINYNEENNLIQSSRQNPSLKLLHFSKSASRDIPTEPNRDQDGSATWDDSSSKEHPDLVLSSSSDIELSDINFNDRTAPALFESIVYNPATKDASTAFSRHMFVSTPEVVLRETNQRRESKNSLMTTSSKTMHTPNHETSQTHINNIRYQGNSQPVRTNFVKPQVPRRQNVFVPEQNKQKFKNDNIEKLAENSEQFEEHGNDDTVKPTYPVKQESFNPYRAVEEPDDIYNQVLNNINSVYYAENNKPGIQTQQNKEKDGFGDTQSYEFNVPTQFEQYSYENLHKYNNAKKPENNGNNRRNDEVEEENDQSEDILDEDEERNEELVDEEQNEELADEEQNGEHVEENQNEELTEEDENEDTEETKETREAIVNPKSEIKTTNISPLEFPSKYQPKTAPQPSSLGNMPSISPNIPFTHSNNKSIFPTNASPLKNVNLEEISKNGLPNSPWLPISDAVRSTYAYPPATTTEKNPQTQQQSVKSNGWPFAATSNFPVTNFFTPWPRVGDTTSKSSNSRPISHGRSTEQKYMISTPSGIERKPIYTKKIYEKEDYVE